MKQMGVIILILLLLWVGCRGELATSDVCGEILDKIVDIELWERGFRDPVLLKQRKQELRRLLSADLAQCEGQRMPQNAMLCVRHAKSAEEISHKCLRQ